MVPTQITYVWTNGDNNGSWADNNNWTNGGPSTLGAGNTAVLQFNSSLAAATPAMTDNLTNPYTVDEIHFDFNTATSAGYTINGTNTINLATATGIVVDAGFGTAAGTATVTFGPNITINQNVASNITNNDTNTTLTFNGGVTLNGFGLTVTGATTGSLAPGHGVVFSNTSVISGAGGLTLAGDVTLGGANTYGATTTVNANAAVNVTNNSGLGAVGNTTNVNGNLFLDNVSVTQATVDLNNNGLIAGAGADGAGTGSNTLTATSAGGIVLAASANGFLGTGGANTRLAINATITGGGGGSDLVIFGNFPVAGSGFVEFQQNNTYAGNTDVGDGGTFPETLQVDSPGGLGAGGAGNGTTVDSGSTLLLNFTAGNILAANAGTGAAENLTLAGTGVNGLGALPGARRQLPRHRRHGDADRQHHHRGRHRHPDLPRRRRPTRLSTPPTPAGTTAPGYTRRQHKLHRRAGHRPRDLQRLPGL